MNLEFFKKNKSIKLLTLVVFILFAIQGVVVYKISTEEIDEQLFKAAKNLEFSLVDEDYFFNDSDENLERKILERLNKFSSIAIINNVDYIYTVILEDNLPIYTYIGGSNDEITSETLEDYYNLSFADAEDDSGEETVDVFNNKKIHYIDSISDDVAYRSVYLMTRNQDGVKYLIGADITTSHRNQIILREIGELLFILIIVLIVMLIVRSLLLKNIYKEKKHIEELTQSMNYDQLTKVFKRENGLYLTEKLVSTFDEKEEEINFILFDIMSLTHINEKFGNEKGDATIIKLASNLKKISKDDDILMRFAGDQFLLVTKQILGDHDVDKLLLQFKNLVKHSRSTNKDEIELNVHNITEKHDANLRVEETIINMLETLRIKKGDDSKGNSELELDIQRGLKEKEFEVFYQPKVNVSDKTVEFEALMRWNHKTRGFLTPYAFIEVAEHSSIIMPLTAFLINQVKEDIKKLETIVSLNISANHFNQVFFLEEILKNYGELKNIEFELTEDNFLNDMEESVNKIKTLNGVGISFLIDDFGTGFSSLSSLAKLPVSTLKVDRSFVVNMFKSDKDMTVLKTIVNLGQGLNLKVVVEGVEEKKEIDFLMTLGVTVFQGYYFGKPESLSGVLKKLEDGTYVDKILELSSKDISEEFITKIK
ncbi:MAG: EAL domain-containing protein [Psychrilyobacter sp.]|nr:EAL domain-containing protein [Psychrilyobacter sp.]